MNNTTVRSAERTLAIFEWFERSGRASQLREIARHCDMPVSTCHALVQTLIKSGYLCNLGRRKELYPTRRLLSMANAIGAHDPYLVRMEAALETLREQTGETVIVGKRQADAVLYLQVLEGSRGIRYSAKAGDHRPLHSTAIGKALLSVMGTEDIKEWLESHPIPALTPYTITDPQCLLREVELGRERGYFTTRGENLADVSGIAVPVLMEAETLAIVVVGPVGRIEQEGEAHLVQLLKAKRSLEQGNSA